MNISLISEYKISFILQRIFQTFFGGLQLNNNNKQNDSKTTTDTNDVSSTNHHGGNLITNESLTSLSLATTTTTKTASWIIQLFIYLFPSCIGMIISILIDLLLIDSYIGILCVSVFGFIFTMIMNIQPQKSANKTRPLIYDGQWPTTDNQTSIQMFKQNHPKPNDHNKYLSNVKTIRQYQSQIILIIIARSLISCSLLGMMTNSFGLKSIKFHNQSDDIIAIFIMIFVWFTFTTVHYSLIIGAPPETTAYSIKFRSIDSFNRSIYMLILLLTVTFIPNQSIYSTITLIICCLPFLWLLGILPPIPSLVFYILEQINIILLAGTATCYIWSSFITILFSFTAIILNHFYFTGRNYFLINLIIGFLSSNKWLFTMNQLHRWPYLIKIIISINSMIAICWISNDFLSIIQQEIFEILFILLIIVHLVKYFKMIYLMNMIKNPLNMIMSTRFFHRIYSNYIFIMIIRIFLHLFIPIVCLMLILQKLDNNDRILNQTITIKHFLFDILVFRMFRHCWQYPYRFGFQTIFIIILDTIYHSFNYNHHHHYNNIIANINEWPLEVRYFCLDIIRMFSIDFCHKFYMVITILFTSVMLRKQKIRYSWTIFIINVILLPINIIIIIISSMLNIPILPLFTLPIFLPSFPRPMKFWSTTPMMLPMTIDDTINDAAYYRQLMPRLIDSLHRKTRFDDRLMWFQVLESGHNYCQIQMKGLELQETSCHTLEASTIDQINEYSFHNNFSTFFNKYFFYAINPMTKATVKTYSDATSVLTGIIDSPDTYVRIKRLFCPIFIWLLLQHKIRLILDEFKQQEHQQQQQNKNDINIQMVKESQINIIVPSDSVMDQHRSSSNNNNNNDDGERQNHSATSSSSSSSSRNNNNGETLKKFSYDDLQPNIQWTNFSYQISRKRKSIQHRINRFIYSNEWFSNVLQILTNNKAILTENELESLILSYNQITNICFTIIFPTNKIVETSMSQWIYEMFNSQTMAKDSMIDENLFDIDLNQICLQSIQETLTDEEIINNLKEFDQNWYFGSIDSPEWRDAVLAEKLQLFSISKDVVKEIYQSHMLTLKDMDIFICLINRSVVDAIWSSLSFELFYLTNDDEERYSIQAHQYIFRNLTVQAADPPLGYPVFASEPILISHII
ncbi:Pecanex-like protein 4 [Dermatophagoides pteronyssinus]|uniref:Pecanex-like protein n=1 Tax=Dermatophagoides pteronyssinus TaxID=6956 RepID=A0ABQ8JK53_DERPT|nr:Pecanex-like protein 4 [Dermatophagoides pteronyssinus]